MFALGGIAAAADLLFVWPAAHTAAEYTVEICTGK